MQNSESDKIELLIKLVTQITQKLDGDYDMDLKDEYISEMISGKGSKSVRINDLLHEEVKKISEAKNISINNYIALALARQLFFDKLKLAK